MLSSGTTFTTPTLIGDAYQIVDDNGPVDSIPSFTLVDGFPASVCLELQSTLGALLVSRMTTTERDDLNAANGMILYNTTVSEFQFYEDDAWANIPAFIGASTIGDIATFSNTTGGIQDIGVSLKLNGGATNLFLGIPCGNATLSGTNNIGYGLNVLDALTSGSNNLAAGKNAAGALRAGGNNVILGYNAIALDTNGSHNVAVGSNSLAALIDIASNHDNVAVGDSAFLLGTGVVDSIAIGSGAGGSQFLYNGCVFMGFGADASVNNLTDACAIGTGATVGVSNAIVLGALGTFVGMGVVSPAASCHFGGGMAGGIRITATQNTNITFSDFIVGSTYDSGLAPQTYVLPVATASHAGQVFIIKKFSSDGNGGILVETSGGQQLDGAAAQSAGPSGWAYYGVFTDGANWYRFI